MLPPPNPKRQGGRGAPPHPCLRCLHPRSGRETRLKAAAACGHTRWGTHGLGGGHRDGTPPGCRRGRPGERLSAFQTCPWKRCGPSRLRCKWPQTKSWGASTPNPSPPLLPCRTLPCGGRRPPGPHHAACGWVQAGGLAHGARRAPPLHPVAAPLPSPACAACAPLPRGWLRCPASPSPCPQAPVPLPSTRLGGEPVPGAQAAPG